MPNLTELNSQRRGSLDSLFSTTAPQHFIDPAVLDSIHASSAASPSLTSFALGSPPPTKRASGTEPAGINRIYTLVKGVVGGVKDAVKGNEQENGKGDDSRSIHSTYSVSGQSTSSYSVTSPTTKKSPGLRSLVSTPHTVSEEFSPTALRKATAPLLGPDTKGYVLSPQDGSVEEPSLPFRDDFETRARKTQDLASRNESIISPVVDVGQWSERRHKSSISNGSNQTSRSNMVSVTADFSTLDYQTESKRRGTLYDTNHQNARVIQDAGFDDLLDDDDAGSEILTDEEEAVAGKGGYLGKVAGMGSVQSDDKSNIPANIGGKPYAPENSRRSSSSAVPSSHSPVVSPNLTTAPNFSRSTSLSMPGRNAKVTTPRHTSDFIFSLKPDSRIEPANASTSSLPLNETYEGREMEDSPPPSSIPVAENTFFQTESSATRRASEHLPGLALLHQASSSSSFTTNTTHGIAVPRPETTKDSAFGNAAYDRLSAIPIDNQAKVGATLRQLRRGEGLTRDFWMKDENCRECFLCAKSFSAWRRKHHCRTCGQIFCSSCTTLIPGEQFGYPGSMRVCKSPCLDIVNDFRHEDSESEMGYESDIQSIMESHDPSDRAFDMPMDHRPKTTPLMAIPATRTKVMKNGHRQRKPIIEFDMTKGIADPSRPGSARSTRPLTGGNKPRGHGHHGHSHSQTQIVPRHQHSRSGRWSNLFNAAQQSPSGAVFAGDEQRAPFQRKLDESTHTSVFQKDSIIDPELAPYMSDDDGDDDNSMSIFATIALEHQRNSETPFMLSGVTEAITNGKTSTSSKSVDVMSPPFGPSTASAMNQRPATPEGSQIAGRRRRNLALLSLSQRSPRKNNRNSFRGLEQLMIPSSALSGSPSHGPPKTPARNSSTRGPLTSAVAVALNPASLQHVKRLLGQMLRSAKMRNISQWEAALMPILLKCTDDLNPNVRSGDAIDLRHFVKVKRIPGGRPGDTAYINGVVFSKNLPLKGMPRQISYPRIAIIAFPLEYHRQQSQLMSLEPVIAQEKEYIKKMVNRLVALRPTLLLVGRNVSGLALDRLYAAGIATVVQVKAPVIEAVSRCAQADVIFSAEEIALKPHRLGRCANFEVKTFVHPDIPTKNHKKTYMYFSGCAKELGCTIVLRGADMRTLLTLKQITEFMVFVMYNLKLETCLMRDQCAQIPVSVEEGSMERSDTIKIDSMLRERPKSISGTSEKPALVSVEEALVEASQKLAMITSNEKMVIEESGVPTDTLNTGETYLTEEHPEQSTVIISESEQVATPDELEVALPVADYYSAYIKEHEPTILSASPNVKFAQPYLLMRARNYEQRLEYLRRLKEQPFDEPQLDENGVEVEQPFQLISPEMLQGKVFGKTRKMRELLKAVHEAEYDKAMYVYQSQKKQWENYLSQSEDLFDPMEHQRIVTLYSMVSSQTSVPCRGPEMIMFEYYNDQFYDEDEYREKKDYYREPDCTLGQYIEDLYRTRSHMCESGCDRKMIDHHRSYVHGQGRVSVHVQPFKCPLKGMENQIIMWSYCKLCKDQIATPVMAMSESTWKYSFGKYLELSYWSTKLSIRPEICPHDLHRDHVRYFGWQDFAVRFEYDAIDLMEIVVPRAKVAWKPELDLKMKNEQFTIMQDKIHRFWDSVISRLKSINVESVTPEKLESCKEEIESLLVRAEEEREWLINKLQEKYTNSKYYEVLPLNRGMRAMQERVAEWDYEFSDFDQKFFPSEKDIRRMAAVQLKRIFLDRDTSTSSLPTDNDSIQMTDKDSTTTSEEGLSMANIASDNQMSPEDTRHVLSSVVEEDAAQVEKSEERAESVSGANESSTENDKKDDSNNEVTEETQAMDTSDELTPTVEKGYMHDSGELNDSGVDGGDLVPTISRAPSTDLESSYTDSASPPEDPAIVLDGLRNTLGSEEMTSIGTPPQSTSGIPVLSKDFIKRNRLAAAGGTPKPSVSGSISRRLEDIGGIAHAIKHNAFHTQSKRPVELGRTKSLDKGKTLSKPKPEKKPLKLKDPKPDKVKLPERLRQVSLSLHGKKSGSSQIPIPRSHPGGNSKVFSLAKHFEELSREFQRERESKEKRQLAARRSRAFPVVQSKPIVEVYRNVEQAVQEVSDDDSPEDTEETTSIPVDISNEASEHPKSPGPPGEPFADPLASAEGLEVTPMDELPEPPETLTETGPEGYDDTSENELGMLSDIEASNMPPDVAAVLAGADKAIAADLKLGNEIPKHEKSSLMKILSNFWAERSASGWTSLDYPLNSSDHVFANSDVIVREDEPSSLIAFALDSSDYSSKLDKMRQSVKEDTGKHPDGCDASGHNHFQKTNTEDDNALQRSLLSDRGIHLKYQFQEGSAKMFCKIFYAEQFDALRRNCGVADRYVESLSRCVKWDSKGGKTKSVFLKTLDDRIVLKQLSQIETTAFLKFAPSYFHIMSEALFHELPTAIAKMLGFYQIFIKNPLTGTDIKWDILVMENLFYDRKMTRTFDLKGSMRNRYVQETGEQNEVLLDENMVDYIYENPLFVREHAKKFLRVCLWNDTLFLERNQVMDYSLMIGIDEESKELVIGLIDCVRTYTFDKKLESLIKATGIAGGGRNKPTITSPKEYKRRFREAMERYVFEAPNCWRQPRVTWMNAVGIPFARKPTEQQAIEPPPADEAV